MGIIVLKPGIGTFLLKETDDFLHHGLVFQHFTALLTGKNGKRHTPGPLPG